MGDKTNLVEFKLRAKDETGSAYDSAKERLEEFVHHNAQTTKLLRHTLEGAGVGFIAEKLGESFSKVGEAAEKLAESLSHASDHTAQMQGLHDVLTSFADSLPIIGGLIKGLDDLDDGLNDFLAATYRLHGATEQQWKAMMSDAGLLRFEREENEKLIEAIKARTEATAKLHGEEERQPGTAAGEAELRAAEEEHRKRNSELVAKRQALQSIVNPTSAERTMISSYADAIAKEDERYALEKKRITEQVSHDESEAFKDRNRIRSREEFDANEKSLDAQAQASAQKLRLLHQDSEAETVLRRRAHDAELAHIEQTRRQRLDVLEQEQEDRKRAGHPVDLLESRLDEERIFADAARARRDANAKFAADQAKAAQDEQNRKLDETEQRRGTLARLQIDTLREEAVMGSDAAKQAAERLTLEEKFTGKRQELNRLLREGHDLSQAEKAGIESQLKGLDALQKIETARLAQGAPADANAPFAQSGELKLGESGSRDAFAAATRQREQDERRHQQILVDNAVKQTDWQNKIYQWLLQNGSGAGSAGGLSAANLGS